MRKKVSLIDVVCCLAVFLVPWQARWIYGYHLLNGQRYEYGTLSVYASSVILALAVIVLLRQRAWSIRLGRAAWILLGWLLFVITFQIDKEMGFHTLSIVVLGFGYYIIARYWKRELVLQALVASGVVQTLIAWQQFIAQHVSASTLLGVAEHAPETLGQSVVIIHGLRTLRAYALLPHPNILGGFLVIAFAYAVHLYLRRTKERNARYLWKQWVFPFISALFLFSGILITFSRAAIISAVLLLIGWFVYVFLIGEKTLVRSFAYLGFSVALLFIVFNIVAGGIWMQRFGVLVGPEQSTEQERLEQISADERIASYHQAAVLVQPKHLFKGVGLGGYIPTLARAFPDLDVFEYQPTHNAFVLMLLEIGAIGAVLYLWFMFQLVKDTWRERRRDVQWQLIFSVVFITAFMGFFDHFLWTQVTGQSLWWLVVGIAANRK